MIRAFLTHRGPYARLLVTLAVVAVLTASACRGASNPAPAISTPTATMVASPSPEPTPAQPPAPPTFALAAPGTSIPAIVSEVITAVSANDTARLIARVKYQQIACTTATGMGGPPKCKPGDAPGTVYAVFPVGRCENEWTADAPAALADLMKQPARLYAAVTVKAPTPDPAPYLPKGQYAVLFTTTADPVQANPAGFYLILDDTNIVRAHAMCDFGPRIAMQLLSNLGTTALLIPPP